MVQGRQRVVKVTQGCAFCYELAAQVPLLVAWLGRQRHIALDILKSVSKRDPSKH